MIKYKVERSTGKPGDINTVERVFENDSPIEARREALDFAATLWEVIKDSPYPLDFNPNIPIMSKNTEPGLNIITSAILDDGDELIIGGDFLESLLEKWDEEVQIYLENGYGYDKKLYNVDATIFNLGNVTVFEDDYINYDLPKLIASYKNDLEDE